MKQSPIFNLGLLIVAGWAVIATSEKTDYPIGKDGGQLLEPVAVESTCEGAEPSGTTKVRFIDGEEAYVFVYDAEKFGLADKNCGMTTDKISYECKSEALRCVMTPNDSAAMTILPFVCYKADSEEVSCTVTLTYTKT